MKRIINQENNKESMAPNWYQNTICLSEVLDNEIALAALLDIARNPTRNYKQLMEDLGYGFEDIVAAAKKLEDAKLIERNPNPASQKFRLAFSGHLLVKQLNTLCPELSGTLGNVVHQKIKLLNRNL